MSKKVVVKYNINTLEMSEPWILPWDVFKYMGICSKYKKGRRTTFKIEY